MAVDGTHGVGQALDVLSVYDRVGCDDIGLQVTHRNRHSAFTQAGYLDKFNDWGVRGYNKFVSVLRGNGTKITPTGDRFDQLPGRMR